jgi:amino acid adenylation domain-containing protein
MPVSCTHTLFESQVERTPDAAAVLAAGATLTYRALNDRANRLAHELLGLGVGPDFLVGVYLAPCPDLLAALLGVWKAGGTYLPLDPGSPASRLALLLQDGRPGLILTQAPLADRLPASQAKVVCIDQGRPAGGASANPPNRAGPDSLACLAYPPVSAGRPRGVLVPHRGLANYLKWCLAAYPVTGGGGAAPVDSWVAFDRAVTGLFVPLLAGRPVHLLPPGNATEVLRDAFRGRADFSVVKVTPGRLELLGQVLQPHEAAGRTRAFVVVGENLTDRHVAFWQAFAPDTLLVHEYGPAETGLGCCAFFLPPGRSPPGPAPIGRPVAGARLYLLDADGRPPPPGAAGELYVGGPGVARGYHNRPALTAERFVPDPFGPDPGGRLFRTGDLARARPDGNLELLGRVADEARGHEAHRGRQGACASGEGAGGPPDPLPAMNGKGSCAAPCSAPTRAMLPAPAAPGPADGPPQGQGAEELAGQLGYWRRRLAGAAALQLPTDRPPDGPPGDPGAAGFTLPAGLAAAVREVGQEHGCTPFMVLLAAFQALLARYCGQEDVCVVTSDESRPRAGTGGPGPSCVNPLVLRADLSGGPSFAGLLGRVREACLEAYAHQELPFGVLVREMQPQRDRGRPPLFGVLFALEHDQAARFALPGLAGGDSGIDTVAVNFDLSLFLTETGGQIDGCLEYSTDLFEETTAERLVGHYRTLLHAAVADPAAPLSALPLLTEPERARLAGWNDTAVDYGGPALLHELLAAQARRTPNACAVRFEGAGLSYAELDRRAAALACRLRALGVGPGVLVGVLMERSAELVVALLGALKAGGAYVPLDPDYPAERLAFLLADAAPAVLLGQSRLLGRLPAHAAAVMCLDDGWGAGEPPGGPDGPAPGPDDLAYVIYTSGSTGRPKGAMNTHRGICNRLLWMQAQYRLTGNDCVLQKTPSSFDVSVWEFFWPLLAGARLVLARPGGHRDPAYLAGLIRSERVSVCHFVPSMLHAFLAAPDLAGACGSLRDVLCSGEALGVELQERFFAALPCRLHNLYGPTEAAVDVTYWECRRGDRRRSVPIGRPVANTQVHVLDGQMQPLPVGVPGELYLGGVQLARGYLNRPELTAERFVEAAGYGRLYKTGDRCRWLAEGVLEYLGRLDHQVKLRGFRVELGEVEASLREHPGVADAVVAARPGPAGEPRLVGYVVARPGQAADAAALRALLRAKLPDYMVPQAFVTLDALPLSPNGKVDRNALPAPDRRDRPGTDDARAREAAGGRRPPPTGENEARMAGLWEEVLANGPVAAEDNFFDLGGDSLQAVRLFNRIRTVFGRDLPLASLIQAPTVAGLVRLLAAPEQAGPVSLVALRTQGARPPFFCVPGVGGDVLGLTELADLLGPEQPFYGIQSRPPEGAEPFPESLAELAGRCVDLVRSAQPDGPYFLGGFSFGAVVAFEAAQQLASRGQAVGALVLLDHHARFQSPARRPRPVWSEVVKGFPRWARRDLTRLTPAYLIDWVKERRKRREDRARPEAAPASPTARLVEYQFRLQRDYVPGPYAGRVTLLRAQEQNAQSVVGALLAGRDLGWGRVARGGVEVVVVPGRHLTVLKKPHVVELAARLRNCLEKAHAAAPAPAPGSGPAPPPVPRTGPGDAGAPPPEGWRVVANDERQYSLWPEARPRPAGWRDAGPAGTRAECLEYIRQTWIDLRPLSARGPFPWAGGPNGAHPPAQSSPGIGVPSGSASGRPSGEG